MNFICRLLPSVIPRTFKFDRIAMMETASDRSLPQSESQFNLNVHSRVITQPKCQGASQAMLMAAGLEWSDLKKAQVGICSVWFEGNPCNMHLLDLGKVVRNSVRLIPNLTAFQFNTIGVSDGISMGTSGMSYSLPSRELIADSIETVVGIIFIGILPDAWTLESDRHNRLRIHLGSTTK